MIQTEPPETAELLTFVRVIDARSMTRAAAELGVPRATIGRRLARLEERLGVRLVRRTTRSLALTEPGERFYQHARRVLDVLGEAESSVRSDRATLSGSLRVSVPPMIDEDFFAMLAGFAAAHPDVRPQVHFASVHVDLRRDGYDVALRAGSISEPGLVSRTLARMPVIAVASPRYLARHGTPRARRDLRRHRCLMGFERGDVPQSQWPASGGVMHVDGAFFSNEIRLLRAAAIRDLGIAMLPTTLVADDLARGALVRVLPGVLRGESRLALVYPERTLVPPQVRAFIEAVTAWAPGWVERRLAQNTQ
ncbi:LysR family transcriptional regulator [Sandaracinus amylolyticus]|nr:LysR family transcriptional regulator [Sandaracinus amylolyticus]